MSLIGFNFLVLLDFWILLVGMYVCIFLNILIFFCKKRIGDGVCFKDIEMRIVRNCLENMSNI